LKPDVAQTHFGGFFCSEKSEWQVQKSKGLIRVEADTAQLRPEMARADATMAEVYRRAGPIFNTIDPRIYGRQA
jgi:hypothetical protein